MKAFKKWITFEQFKRACRFNAQFSGAKVGGQTFFGDPGFKCRYDGSNVKPCAQRRCPLLK